MTTHKVKSIAVIYDAALGWAAYDEMADPQIVGVGTSAAGAIEDLLLQTDGPPQPLAPKPKPEEWVSRVTDAPTWADGTKPATEAHQHWFRKFSDE